METTIFRGENVSFREVSRYHSSIESNCLRKARAHKGVIFPTQTSRRHRLPVRIPNRANPMGFLPDFWMPFVWGPLEAGKSISPKNTGRSVQQTKELHRVSRKLPELPSTHTIFCQLENRRRRRKKTQKWPLSLRGVGYDEIRPRHFRIIRISVILRIQ